MKTLEITDCVCTYDGRVLCQRLTCEVEKKILLEEEMMPFKTKQPPSSVLMSS